MTSVFTDIPPFGTRELSHIHDLVLGFIKIEILGQLIFLERATSLTIFRKIIYDMCRNMSIRMFIAAVYNSRKKEKILIIHNY